MLKGSVSITSKLYLQHFLGFPTQHVKVRFLSSMGHYGIDFHALDNHYTNHVDSVWFLDCKMALAQVDLH